MKDYTGFTSFILFDKVAQSLTGKSAKELYMDRVHTIYISYFIHLINYLMILSRIFLFVQKDNDSIVSLKIKKIIKKIIFFKLKLKNTISNKEE